MAASSIVISGSASQSVTLFFLAISLRVLLYPKRFPMSAPSVDVCAPKTNPLAKLIEVTASSI